MLLQQLCPLLVAAAGAANAFKNTSPFFVLSTEELQPDTLQSSQLSTASSIQDRLISSLSPCNAKAYVLISSQGLTAADLRHMSHLQKWQAGKQYRDLVEIPEVLGQHDLSTISDRLSEMCGAETGDFEQFYLPPDSLLQGFSVSHGSVVLNWDFPGTLPQASEGKARAEALKKADKVLDYHLSKFANGSVSHVLIWTTTPPPAAGASAHEYDMDDSEPPFQSIMHTDLKRDVHLHLTRQRNNSSASDPQAGLPLFEKYQFLSPPIFMGLSVSLLLFIILYVGISAIAGLEVSYAAFSKEMGPAAQNKGKQQ